MAGTIVADTIQDGAGNSTSMDNAIYGSAKAWVNFNGTAATIRASYNVSSITKNGTGDYTANFTNAFADVNYSSVATSSEYMCGIWTKNTTNCQIRVTYATNTGGAYTFVDNTLMNLSCFR